MEPPVPAQSPEEPPADAPALGDTLSLDMLAAMVRADAGELGTFVTVLGTKLAAALPGHVRCLTGKHLLRSTPDIRRIEVTLDDRVYVLARSSHGLEASIGHVVRGISLRNDKVELGEWIDALCAHLADTASRSASARAALAQLLT